jgi:nucleotide-binding universal stress UspA family protein
MVPQIKKILFPTDLSQASRNAYGYAVAIAQKFEAAIAILHVMDDAADEGGAALRDFLGEQRWQQLQRDHEQDAREILIGKQREGAMIREALGAFAETAGQVLGDTGVKTDEIVVVRGNVVEEILSESIGRNCDLIVMGYVARGKIEEAILGSTSRRVLRSSNIPVMLVRAPELEREK